MTYGWANGAWPVVGFFFSKLVKSFQNKALCINVTVKSMYAGLLHALPRVFRTGLNSRMRISHFL